MNVVIRKAKLEDLKTIQDLNHALFLSDADKDKKLNHDWPYLETGKEYFKGAIEGKTGVCFVAEKDNEIVGYLAGSIKFDSSIYRQVRRSELENMFVTEECRGQGIGEKLAKKFIDWSKENDVTHTFVSAYWLNERAIKFYKRLGFEPLALELEARL